MSDSSEDDDPMKYFLKRMDEKPADSGEGVAVNDMTFADYKQAKIDEMLKDGWVLPGQVTGGPPARAAPLPPRKTTAPAGVFQQKLDYDASHMWRNTTEEDDESDDGLAIPWEGTTVDSKYSIGKEIGSGGTSFVYALKDKDTGADVCVKVISDLTSELIPVSQWKDTAERIKKSQGKGVVEIIDSYNENDTLFIVLKREAGNLFKMLWRAGDPYTEKQASDIIRQVLGAVKLVHAAGYAHNDVTTGNLLSDPTGREVKLCGFSKCTEGTVKGDLSLRSNLKPPEVLGGEKQHDSKVDIWSVGLLAHLILSGKLPFSSPDAQKLKESILECDFSMDGEEWECVSDSGKAFVKVLLAKDPADRPDADAALELDWLTGGAGDAKLAQAQKNLGPTLYPRDKV